jgi:VanZ family protein
MKIYLPPLMLMGLIFISSSIPMDGESEHLKFLMELKPTVQNLLHIPLFGLLAYLWLNALTKNGCPAKKKLIITIIITVSYGLLDEFHQSFIPGRYASLSDMLLNIVGITTGIAVYLQRESVRSK